MKYLSEEQNKCFVGTGELNKAGDSLSVFLDKYDPDKYQNPCNTVDTLVFTKEDSQVKRILLIKEEIIHVLDCGRVREALLSLKRIFMMRL